MPECRNGPTWPDVARVPEAPDVARRGPKCQNAGMARRGSTWPESPKGPTWPVVAQNTAPQCRLPCLGAAAAPPRAAAPPALRLSAT
eukprot:scaffold95396_cov30-Phaeocystis_antarctica.AAC.1